MLEKIAKQAAIQAGKKILKIYNENFEIEKKVDESPLTTADKLSNVIIKKYLKNTNISVLSEEDKDDLSRLKKEYLWIIDPLDGTKDFINKTGEFSVMIGLIKNGKPILGVVYVPTEDKLYSAKKGEGCFLEHKGRIRKININKNNNDIVVSRNHQTNIEKQLIEELSLKSVPCGSSGVKFGLIAEGKAGNYLNLYKNFKEWDTAAPEIILTEAGGKVTDIQGNKLVYNKEFPYNNGCIGTNKINHDRILDKLEETENTNSLIKPHGGKLISLEIDKNIRYQAEIVLNKEQIIDLHNIANGTYSPLTGLLKKDDFLSVINNFRLSNGVLWAIPIVLDISNKTKNRIKKGNVKNILLKDKNGKKLAILHNFEIYDYSKDNFTKNVFGTNDIKHPGVENIYNLKENLIGGDIKLLNDIDLKINNYFSPKETRSIFEKKGWNTVVAFQTRNPPHVSHEYLQKCALEGCHGLFINPVIGKKKVGDFKDEYIIGAYKILIKNYFKESSVFLGTLPITMNYAGPREAIHHAIIRQNFGCSHIIIGRDHAGVGNYYGTYDAQKIFDIFNKKDINIKVLKYENAGFCSICKTVTTNKTCPHSDEDKVHISGTKLRKKIQNKEILPSDFMRKEISEYLIERDEQFVI